MRKIALIIGNSQYDIAPLPRAIEDAALMTKRFGLLGYIIIGGASIEPSVATPGVGENLDKAETTRLCSEFLALVTEGSTAVIFYSGHAVQIKNQNYILPVRTPILLGHPEANLINIGDLILKIAEKAGPTGEVVVFLNACRENPFIATHPRHGVA